MEVYRLHHRRYDPLDGNGAARIGGRWNPLGVHMVYASHAYEGALLEQLVHGGIGRLPSERMASRIIIPDDCEVPSLDIEENPDWRDEMRSREIGEAWARSGRSLALVVPSFMARPWGRNVLINPVHPEFGRVAVADVADVVWDPRVV